ncbi:hypothetical protein ACIQC9_03715 [Brevundimonas sp. NPDC092305]|uniref:hypothetical protein n=1 Tax=Brevundimonas sp. NPDC092305 TaxID=3363957 RepID=UPI00382C0320
MTGEADGSLRRLIVARHLLRMAESQGNSASESEIFTSLILLQDACELFLVAASDHKSLPLKLKASFEETLTTVENHLGSPLERRGTVLKLNAARVTAKHHGICPDPKEVQGFVAASRQFLQAATTKVFGWDFDTVSRSTEISAADVKAWLVHAEAFYEAGDFSGCLSAARKALYLTFEKPFDIAPYRDGGNLVGLLGPQCDAPAFARSAEYIGKSVRIPFDHIVIDHGLMESRLLGFGIRPITFWNVRRITPRVYLSTEGIWLTENALDILRGDHIQESARYALSNITEMIVQKQQHEADQKYIGIKSNWVLRLKSEGAKLFEKADVTANFTYTPPGLLTFSTTGSTPDLKGENEFWNVWAALPGDMIYGYILEDQFDHSWKPDPVAVSQG